MPAPPLQVAYEPQFIPYFEAMVQPLKQRNITVVNATPDSALVTFSTVRRFKSALFDM